MNTLGNRVSTLLSDEQIIDLYWQRDEQAIRETDRKYKNYLYTVAYHIVHDALDCEECLNDTYLGVWNIVPPERPRALKAFLTAIVRRISVNRYHHNLRKRRIPSEMTRSLSELEDCLADCQTPAEELDVRRLGQVLSDFIRALPQRKSWIFMSRYYAALPIDDMAHALGVSRSTIHKELAAIRKNLRETLESEGYFI